MSSDTSQIQNVLKSAEAEISALFDKCVENAPNFGVRKDCFVESIENTIAKYLAPASPQPLTHGDIAEFLAQLQADELFMAIACAKGSERAWWEFDQQHRSYMERVARHLAKTEVDAQEVIDQVYVELYGTRVVDGERQSKFSTYSGRGSLRGWLRTVIWHSIVDLHRAGHDEVSLDELTETVGEGAAQASFAEAPTGGEDAMIDHITRERYRKTTLSAIGNAFSSLDPHEKLLLLYYHVEGMKLREISRLVENEASPLRGWFQRRSASREKNPSSRIHESTVMRWLEKCYERVLEVFKSELTAKHGMKPEEIEICMDLALQDLAGGNIFRNLTAT
jgi:RNA polymerase sigma-70 factor (ECF subfamily)